MNNKISLGVIIGNRDFFPDRLVSEASVDILALFNKLSINPIMLNEQQVATPVYGGPYQVTVSEQQTIHPPRKQVGGERLAYLELGKMYVDTLSGILWLAIFLERMAYRCHHSARMIGIMT